MLHKADAGSSSPGCSGILHFDRTMSPHSHPQPFPGGATSAGVSSQEGRLTPAFIIPRGSARTVLPAERGWVNRGQGWSPWHADPQMCNQVQTTKPLRKCVWGSQGQPEAQPGGTTLAFVLSLQPSLRLPLARPLGSLVPQGLVPELQTSAPEAHSDPT